MKICQHCGDSYQDHIDFCFDDGEVLHTLDLTLSPRRGLEGGGGSHLASSREARTSHEGGVRSLEELLAALAVPLSPEEGAGGSSFHPRLLDNTWTGEIEGQDLDVPQAPENQELAAFTEPDAPPQEPHDSIVEVDVQLATFEASNLLEAEMPMVGPPSPAAEEQGTEQGRAVAVQRLGGVSAAVPAAPVHDHTRAIWLWAIGLVTALTLSVLIGGLLLIIQLDA